VTAAGYALGTLFDWDAPRRRTVLLRLGLGLTAAFVALRWLDTYGDPAPWRVQRTAAYTVASFLNATKYPPSLLYLLMTLGPALLVLRALDAGAPRWLSPVAVVGKVPMFYFALHVVLIHLLALVACGYRYGAVHWVFETPTPDRFPFTQPPGWPAPLPVVYAVWTLVGLTLWPLCRWYAALRARRRGWGTGYV
jgi:uncharacterized membrane protein